MDISKSEDSIRFLKDKYNIRHSNKKLSEYKPKLELKKEEFIDKLIIYQSILSKLFNRLSWIKKRPLNNI